MPLNRDSLSKAEVRAYAVLTGICWVLSITSVAVFALAPSVPVKWLAVAALIGSLLGAAVFNWARRFGIRVIWSRRFREKL